MSCLRREGRSFTRLWNEAQTGHRLTKQKVKGHEFSAWADSVTAGATTLPGGYLRRPESTHQVLRSGAERAPWFHPAWKA